MNKTFVNKLVFPTLFGFPEETRITIERCVLCVRTRNSRGINIECLTNITLPELFANQLGNFPSVMVLVRHSVKIADTTVWNWLWVGG